MPIVCTIEQFDRLSNIYQTVKVSPLIKVLDLLVPPSGRDLHAIE